MRNVHNPNDASDLPLFGGTPVPAPEYVSPAAAKARDNAIAALARRSGEDFIRAAGEFVVQHLKTHGPKSAEELTDACKKAGIIPAEDRAFGAVYSTLRRRGLIAHDGYAPRNKGNGSVGNRWRAAK